MIGEIFVSLLLIFIIVLAFGFLYLWILWLITDFTNP
jgi:hypothetical protein